MNVFLDGIYIVLKYIGALSLLLMVILGLGLFSIRHNINQEINPGIKLLAALGVGIVVLCVVSYVLVALSHFWPFLLQPGSYIILFFAILVLLQGIWSREVGFACDIRVALGTLILFLLLVMRLAFLKRIILPPYSDSPIHYQIVFGMLHPDTVTTAKLSLGNILSNYYHFGFHALAAWLASVAKIEPADAISLLGQVFLVIGPVSVLFLTYTLTKDSKAAIFAGLLAAIGWQMPAFAVNWGKFPALGALAAFPTVVAIFNLHPNGVPNKGVRLFWGLVLFVGIALFHTRIIICVLLTAICYFLSTKMTTGVGLGFFKSVGYSLLFIVSLWPLLQPFEDFYSGLPVLLVLIVLLPFAFQTYPGLAVGIFLFTFGTWLIEIVPKLFGNDFQPLLGKQFIEMMLYIPLSIMGGAGFAGIMKRMAFSVALRWSTAIAFVACVMIGFLQRNSIYPDSCCDYFGESDRLAFAWLQEKASKHTLVLISASVGAGKIVGTDAGIWLLPLIGQPTNKLPFNIAWNSTDEIKNICRLGAQDIFIYMGGREYSFDNTRLAQEEQFELVFKSGRTLIYQLHGCP